MYIFIEEIQMKLYMAWNESTVLIHLSLLEFCHLHVWPILLSSGPNEQWFVDM